MGSKLVKPVNFIRKHLYLYLFLFISLSLVTSSYLILKFETPYADSQIRNISDAIWWSTVGISTIGIGNIVPISTAGRYLTLFLMIVGVIVFSVITAKIASVFTEEEVREDLNRDIKVIEGDLNKVEKDIAGEVAVADKEVENKLNELVERVKELEGKKKANL